MSKRSVNPWKQDWNPIDTTLQRSSRRSKYRIPNSTQKISKSRKRKRSEQSVSFNKMEIINETISSSKSRKRKKTEPSPKITASAKRTSSRTTRKLSRTPKQSSRTRKLSKVNKSSPINPEVEKSFRDFSQMNSPIESYDNENDITMAELKRKYHDNILPNLTNLLLNNENNEKYNRDNGDLYAYRLKKQLKHKKFSEIDTRYINIIYYKKNLNYLYKYISFILNSTKTNKLYIFNIVCDHKTYENLINDDYDISEYDEIDDKYISMKKIINDDINIPIKEDNFIIDLYSCQNNLMYGIGFKRAFINKLFTDNRDRFDNHDLCVLNIDDNITNIVDIIDCMKKNEECKKSPLRQIGGNSINIEDMCISIKKLFEIMLYKIPNECYIMGIYKGAGEGDSTDPDDAEINFNTVSNSAAIYKLSLQKIFRLNDENLFYYPYFSRCCEDRFFNTIALKHCYRINQYKLRFGHFINTGDHNDVLLGIKVIINEKEEEIKFHYYNGYKNAKTYYNHILKYIIDLKKTLKHRFKFKEDRNSCEIIINNKQALGIKSAIYNVRSPDKLTQTHKYAKYQIVLFVLYLLFKDGYRKAEENLNNYIKYQSGNSQIMSSIIKYCQYLLGKYKNIKDSRMIQKFANEMERALDPTDKFTVFNENNQELNKRTLRNNKIF
jgi:hypothetical protein